MAYSDETPKKASTKKNAKKKASKKKVSKKTATKKTAKKKAAKKTASKKAVKTTKKSSGKKKVTRKKSPRKKSTTAKKKSQKKPSNSNPSSSFAKALWLKLFSYFILICAFGVLLGSFYFDRMISQQFEGNKWELPARVYSRPLEIYPGKKITLNSFKNELNIANYRVNKKGEPGSYFPSSQSITLTTRDFDYWDGNESSQAMTVYFSGDSIESIRSSSGSLSLVRIDPAQIAAIYPERREDRSLLRLDDIPVSFIDLLLSTEDREFYQHHGLSLKGIFRALVSNVLAGKTRQGGSTLTQQLVKNYFLTRERTLLRKGKEAWMSLLLELRYSKNEILEAYINEVFLGQDGERAIHGFGLASEYYFDKPLNQASLAEQAMLVGLVKGATYYNPRKYPDRALQRRNLVLSSYFDETKQMESEFDVIKNAPLNVVSKPKSYRNRYLAFIDLVKTQLRRDYKDNDLQTEGLRIFTTLSPTAQGIQENAIAQHITALESRNDIAKNALQAAVILTDSRSGEVLALSGGRDANETGFNRALHAQRAIGSLVKPAVYLSALSQPKKYQLGSWIDDTKFQKIDDKGEYWSPKNYDGKEYGKVRLYYALSKSLNLATSRLGLDIGVEQVSEMLKTLGLKGTWPPYPSLFLGAIEHSPYDVAQMYQTLSAQGFYSPLRAIREVLMPNGERLQRYPLRLEQRIDENISYQMTWALQNVAKQGTAKRLSQSLPRLNVAGKTGTSNQGRDSWFAAYTGEHLGVVWVGQDENKPTPLSGSSGALPIWEKIFKNLPSRPLEPVQPQDIVLESVDVNGDEACKNVVQLPYIKGTKPDQGCKPSLLRRFFPW